MNTEAIIANELHDKVTPPVSLDAAVDTALELPRESISPAARSKTEQVRRTRGSASQKKRSAASRAHGRRQSSPHKSAPRKSAPERRAASDDAHGAPAAVATPSAVAGTDRDACAEVARVVGGGKAKTRGDRLPAAAVAEELRVPSDLAEISPGREYLPDDGPGFVDEMHARVDLWEVGKKLLHSVDEKIAKATWDRLMEMRYGKNAVLAAEEAPKVIFDIARPVRD